jgi:hypothetical protein
MYIHIFQKYILDEFHLSNKKKIFYKKKKNFDYWNSSKIYF